MPDSLDLDADFPERLDQYTPRDYIRAADLVAHVYGEAQVDAIVGPGGLSGAHPDSMLELADAGLAVLADLRAQRDAARTGRVDCTPPSGC